MIIGIVASSGAVTPVITPAMLDPLHTGTGVVLSDLNLTATKNSGGAAWRTSRSTYGPSSGKYYFEATLVEFSGSFVGVALGDSSADVQNFFGSDQHGVIYVNNGTVYRGGSLVTTIQTTSEGQVVGIAFDVDAELVWFRTSGGNWNNSGTADPSTGTGGIAFGSLMSGGIYPGACVQTSPNDQVTVNFGPSFANSAPSGFGIVGQVGGMSISAPAGITETA